MNRITIKCSCHINRTYCPLHGINKGNRRRIIKNPLVQLPPTIKQGGGTVDKRLNKITWKDLRWTNDELKVKTKEELWTIACLLQIPHRNPGLNERDAKRIDLLRHIKAALGMYKPDTLESNYFSTYPEMRGIVPITKG